MSRTTIARRGAGIVLAAGIAGAAFGAAPAPADAARQPVCIQAPKVTKFLSVENPFGPDHSFAKLTWSPELCPNGSGWRVFSDPVLTETGAGSVLGYGLNLEAPARSGTGVTYRGQLRACLPIGAGYAGLAYTGTLCNTLANGEFSISIDSQRRVSYRFPGLRRTALGRPGTYVWTNTLI